MDQKLKLVAAALSGELTVSALARAAGISRKTAHKWIGRYRAEGVEGLKERSRAPASQPNATPHAVVERVLALKHRHPQWGPRKLRDYLVLNEPEQRWPAASTLGELLHRHGLVKPRGRRRRAQPMGRALSEPRAPNSVWSADFKGQARLGKGGPWCYPLTLSDNHSRYLLLCEGLKAPTEQAVWPLFERAFREYGLPEVIRTDNGSPFASVALAGLTRLSVWWLKLGILPERTRPGRPQENGRHERMHRTLKDAAMRPPADSWREQQRRFESFCREYNEERPHESLGGVPPQRVYRPSPRAYPQRLPAVEYPEHLHVRRVRRNGEMKWGGRLVYVSEALRGEWVALEPIAEGRWQLRFAALPLAVVDDRLGRILRPS